MEAPEPRRLVALLIEYPRGSGVTADYSDAERAFMREIVGEADTGAISRQECESVLAFLHDAKAFLGARLIGEPSAVDEPEQTLLLPLPDSPFQIPRKARAKLGLPELPARVEDDRPAVEARVALDRIVEPELVSDAL